MALNTFPCNPYPISTEELNKGNNDDLNARVSTLEGDVTDLNSNKANQITIAPFFNAETAYDVGDLVYYNGLSYRCTNAHEGEWDADDFAATTISNELDTLRSGLTSGITGNFPVTYTQGWQIIKHITFDRAFASVPAVVLQSLFTGGASGDVYEPVNITSSGFDINMYSLSAGSFDYFNFCWIAATL